jgi:peptide-methionine (S)-S-oxide reductase
MKVILSRSLLATAVLAGGCFWGTEAVFEHLRGVVSVTSGFARPAGSGGDLAKWVPVEAVQVVYDPSRITYRQLLEVFFTVAHDPTSRDRQGPDEGAEYRAVAFYQTPAEHEAINAYVVELKNAKRFARPIVTEVRSFGKFTAAPELHQDYGRKHPDDGYIVQNDAPKLVSLKQSFPALYVAQAAP